ncbi:hypothetical protein [Streptomyces sp. NPDC026673]|uniref:hypothetical protein n=1 Tax=Streptomyces sp. NPDC026673 TaxID=3155724 RepID=UPI00340DE9F0
MQPAARGRVTAGAHRAAQSAVVARAGDGRRGLVHRARGRLREHFGPDKVRAAWTELVTGSAP